MKVTLMTDASVCGQTGAAGFGYWVVSSRGGYPGQGPLQGFIKDSFEGELKAVANALAESVKLNRIEYGDKVLIQLDNSGVVKCLNRTVKVRHSEAEVISYIRNLVSKLNLKLEARHVKGHTGRKQVKYIANKMCDMRAKHEMKKARETLNGKSEPNEP